MSMQSLRLAASEGTSLQLEAVDSQPLMLMVLNGGQTGATVTLQTGQRYLLGDGLDNDVVIETGVPQCQVLLLVNGGEVTIRHLTGQAWLRDMPLVPQQTQVLPLNVPVTLGRACFAVGPLESALRVLPLPELLRAADTASAVVPLERSALKSAVRIKRVAAIAAIAACATVSVAAIELWRAAQAKEQAAQRVAGFAQWTTTFAQQRKEAELVVQQDTRQLNVTVTGYVLEPETSVQVHAQAAEQQVALRWHARPVRSIRAKLDEQLMALGLPGAQRYAGQGTFELSVPSAQLATLRRAGLALFRDTVGLERLVIKVTDVVWLASQAPVEISLTIPRTRPDRVEVQAPDVPYIDPFVGPMAVSRVEVDTRARALVTRSGERFFEGAKLPDGSELAMIAEDAVLLTKNGAMRKIEGLIK